MKDLIVSYLKRIKEWWEKVTTPAERLCEKHARIKKPKYYLLDSENCSDCLNNVIQLKPRKKR